MLRTALRNSSLFFLFLVWIAPLAPAQAEIVDRVVLRVNDRIATLHQYEQRKADAMAQIQRQASSPEELQRMLAQLGPTVFRDLLDELLVLSRADQLRIRPDEAVVDQELARRRTQFGFESDDEFAAALASQGLSLAQFRGQLRDQLRFQEVMYREIVADIELEEDDLRRYYRANLDEFEEPESRKVREIVVLETTERQGEELARLAAEIRAEIAAGADLEVVAAGRSEDGVTSGVIDLGWVVRGELAEALEAAVWSLDVGEVSQPTDARGGLHLLIVDESREASVKPFQDVAETIEFRERSRLAQEKQDGLMRDLEAKAYIVADPPAEAAGFRQSTGSEAPADPFEGIGVVNDEAPDASTDS